MNVGDKVYLIYLNRRGTIMAIDTGKYFVTFIDANDSIGYWFRRNELTEAD